MMKYFNGPTFVTVILAVIALHFVYNSLYTKEIYFGDTTTGGVLKKAGVIKCVMNGKATKVGADYED